MVENRRTISVRGGNPFERLAQGFSDDVVGPIVQGVGGAVSDTFNALEGLVNRVTHGKITAYDDVGLTSTGMRTNPKLYTAAVHMDGRKGYKTGDIFEVTNHNTKKSIFVLANDVGGMPNATVGLDLYEGKATDKLGMTLSDSAASLSNSDNTTAKRIGHIPMPYSKASTPSKPGAHGKAYEALRLLADVNEGRASPAQLREWLEQNGKGGASPETRTATRDKYIEKDFAFLGLEQSEEQQSYLDEKKVDVKDKNAVFGQLKKDVAAIQKELKALGVKLGKADGLAGEKTTEGLETYEGKNGIDKLPTLKAIREKHDGVQLAKDQEPRGPDATPKGQNDELFNEFQKWMEGKQPSKSTGQAR